MDIQNRNPKNAAPIPIFVPRFWLLVAKTIFLKRRHNHHGDIAYKEHLRRFYTRQETQDVESYGDAYQMIRPMVVQLAGAAPTDSVLDVATGAGYQAASFASQGHFTVGVDYVHDRVSLATERNPQAGVRWCSADAAHLPFKDNSFDVVTISLALHDMPLEPRLKALAEIGRVARKAAVILEPSVPKSWFGRHLYTFLITAVDESMYVGDYLRHDLRTHLQAVGLNLVSEHRCYYNLLRIYCCAKA